MAGLMNTIEEPLKMGFNIPPRKPKAVQRVTNRYRPTLQRHLKPTFCNDKQKRTGIFPIYRTSRHPQPINLTPAAARQRTPCRLRGSMSETYAAYLAGSGNLGFGLVTRSKLYKVVVWILSEFVAHCSERTCSLQFSTCSRNDSAQFCSKVVELHFTNGVGRSTQNCKRC